jgi:hypothetical protein
MFDRLVAYGCSHTAAYESADTEWWPAADEYKLKHGPAEFFKFMARTYPGQWNHQQHIENQKTNSFANKLAELIGIPCANKAIPGNSLAQIVWQLNTDIANNQITSNDLILIGLPNSERVICFDDQAVDTLRLADSLHYADFDLDEKTMVTYFNREQTMFLYLTYIQSLLYLEKTQLSRQILFVDPDNGYRRFIDFIQSLSSTNYFKKTVFNMLQDVNARPVWLDIHNVRLCNAGDQRHAGMHATAEMHKTYAEKLFKNFKEIKHD